MLEIFLGGYLFHPAALDYSGDTCQNGCAYCFANINKEFRRGNLPGAINSLYKKEATTYKDILLKMGYPICVSNRSDPFSANNIKDTLALFTHLAEMKNGTFIQTKCGAGMEEALEILGDRRDVVVYITITTMRDDIARVLEPKAPPPSQRLAIAKDLHRRGYLVLLAANPLSESWMPREDVEWLADEMKDEGMNHICLEMLDIKRARLAKLGEGRKKRMGTAIDTLGSQNRHYVRECTEYFVHRGFSVAKKGMPFRSTFFDDLKNRLKFTMPVMQDFVNYCFDRYGTTGAAVTYREFEDVIAKDGIFLHTIRQNAIRDYLLRSGFVSWKDNQQIHSHKELLKIVWNDPRHRISIQRHSLFTVIGRDGKPSPDPDGNIRLWFDGRPNLSPKKGVKSP